MSFREGSLSLAFFLSLRSQNSAEMEERRDPVVARTTTGIENIGAVAAMGNKSWQHLVDFTGRRTAFYFCFAPIIDEL